ncbi:hypothetical protein LZ31DRAFT_550812 [Colletotrichum somersetense]|nr:hypothetical protein LZ31DRAFT_550812 [Colletotrichum somersetense]
MAFLTPSLPLPSPLLPLAGLLPPWQGGWRGGGRSVTHPSGLRYARIVEGGGLGCFQPGEGGHVGVNGRGSCLGLAGGKKEKNRRGGKEKKKKKQRERERKQRGNCAAKCVI